MAAVFFVSIWLKRSFLELKTQSELNYIYKDDILCTEIDFCYF